MNSRVFILLLFFGLLSCDLTSQVNIKVGYSVGFPQADGINRLLSAYQPQGAEVVESFGSLNFTHGLQLGLRYRIANTGMELGWETMTTSKSSLTYNPVGDNFSDRTYDFGINSYHLGVEHYFSRYGIGIAMHSQKLSVNRPIGNNELALVNERNPSVRLHLIWQVQESDAVSLMIKPYYQIGLGDYNFSRLADDLGLTTVGADKLHMFGLSMVFYNGRQRN